MAEKKTEVTATGTIQSARGYYHGYVVTTTLSAAAVTIYDNTSAAGTVIDVIPASTTAGTRGVLSQPVPVANGIHVVVAGTGTVLFVHD